MSAPLTVLATAFLARTSQLGLFSAETLILLDRDVATDRIGLVMTAAAAGGALAQLAVSRWGHSCRTTRITLLGTLLQSVGCLAFALLTPWWSLAAADFLVMAGGALTGTGLRAALATDRSAVSAPSAGRSETRSAEGEAERTSRLERAYGRLTAAQMLGALTGPLGAGAALLHGSGGAAWYATAVGVAAMAVAGSAVRRERASASIRPGPTRPDSPPLVRSGVGRARLSARSSQGARVRTGPNSAPDAPGALFGLVWPALVLLFGITALYGGYSVVWAVYLRGLGAADSVVAWSMACLALPALLLSPRAGSLLRRVPRTMLIRCAALLLGASACLYPLVDVTGVAVALSLAEGFLLAIALPLISAKVARDAGPEHTARAFGALGAADALGSGLGTAVAGALLAQGGAGLAFRFSGVLCLVCAALSLVPVPAAPPGSSSPSPSLPTSPSASSPPPVSTPLTSISPLPNSLSESGRSRHVPRHTPRIRALRR
ncbi:MFS transporter [Streptomyces sp. NBC_00687]|uniref:MFS transporter n=1 Tax=Streptomyces sp. NBC_00687 TaxID=2975807 RepID=UPI00225C1DCC|nr:MFS transporter [Streptomyces sp. NBC_00687]MCX4919071.1 MFS transporter [Streptomyces sp. NBC_00687]